MRKCGKERNRYDANTSEEQTHNEARVTPYAENDSATKPKQRYAKNERRYQESDASQRASSFEYRKGTADKYANITHS